MWRDKFLPWSKEIKRLSPSLASVVYCADLLEEDEKRVVLMVGNNFHQQMLSAGTAMQTLLQAASVVGLPEKKLEFVTVGERGGASLPTETVVAEIWEHLA